MLEVASLLREAEKEGKGRADRRGIAKPSRFPRNVCTNKIETAARYSREGFWSALSSHTHFSNCQTRFTSETGG